jgi:DNA repair photolyase
VDAALLKRLFGLELAAAKDPYQRPACGCAVSKDIGMYDTCRFGCAYCYATSSFERARRNHARHDPEASELLNYPRDEGNYS